jgi:hypothetical protein
MPGTNMNPETTKSMEEILNDVISLVTVAARALNGMTGDTHGIARSTVERVLEIASDRLESLREPIRRAEGVCNAEKGLTITQGEIGKLMIILQKFKEVIERAGTKSG